MKQLSFIILFISQSFLGNAQDTLCKRNGQTLITKIIEVNTTEIKYRNYTNLDGPLFVCSLNDIKYIKYLNGQVDTLKLVAPRLDNTNTGIFYSRKGLIDFSHGKYFYEDSRLSSIDVLIMSNKLNMKIKSPVLNQEILNYKRANTIASTEMVLGISALSIAAIGTVFITFDGYSKIQVGSNGEILRDLFTTVGVGGIITSCITNHYKKEHLKKIVKIYNTNVYE